MRLSRDIAYLIKEDVDPITYGRLLSVCTAFGGKNENLAQRKRKLKQLLSELPEKGARAKKTRSAYVFFSKKRRPELKQELPDATALAITHELGREWGQMTREQKGPFIDKSHSDFQRYLRESDPSRWEKLQHQRIAVEKALANIDEDELIRQAQTLIRKATYLRSRDCWLSTIHMAFYSEEWQQTQKQVYQRHKVPKRGNTPYNVFLKENYKRIRFEMEKNSHLDRRSRQSQLLAEIGRQWKVLPIEERKYYEKRSHEDRVKRAKEAFEE